jgi:hypothetical protein
MLTPLPNLPAKNCRFNLKSVAHVKPFRKDITPEEQERLMVQYYQHLSGERVKETDALRKQIARRSQRAQKVNLFHHRRRLIKMGY